MKKNSILSAYSIIEINMKYNKSLALNFWNLMMKKWINLKMITIKIMSKCFEIHF